MLTQTPAVQITPTIEAYEPALQITTKIEANNKAINSISTHATRVRKHVFYNSPVPRKLASNANSNLNNSKYVEHASQSPINTSLPQQNISKNKQLFQIRNKVALAQRESQISQSKFPRINRHSSNIFKSHHPKIKSVLFASKHSTIQSCILNSKKSSQLNHHQK